MRTPLLVAAALVMAGCSAPPAPPDGNASAPAPPVGPGATLNLSLLWAHEHASFALFLAGERVSFAHPDYDLQRVRVVRAHLHVQQEHGEHVIHVEDHFPGGVPNVTVGEFFAIHGLRFGPGSLTLDTRAGHNGTSWNDTAARGWQVWVAEREGNFTQATDGPGHVLGEGQRILVTYAGPGEDLGPQRAAVPEPPGPATPPG